MKVNPEQWPEGPGGTRSHRGRAAQNLYLKFRVQALERITKSDLMRRLERAVRTGVVPAGIRIHAVDWASGREGHYNQGEIDPDDLRELRIFYGALEESKSRGGIRAERVAQA